MSDPGQPLVSIFWSDWVSLCLLPCKDASHTNIFSLGQVSTQLNWAQVSFLDSLNEMEFYYCNRRRWVACVQISHHITLDWIEGLKLLNGKWPFLYYWPNILILDLVQPNFLVSGLALTVCGDDFAKMVGVTSSLRLGNFSTQSCYFSGWTLFGFHVALMSSQWALTQLAPLPLISARWRVPSWVKDP